jgi:hypothetical protein
MIDTQCWNYEVYHATLHAKEEGCKLPKLIGWWRALIHVYCHPLVCKVKGHEWEEVGHCTPDSGYIGRQCSRCGLLHGEALY